MVWRGGFFVGGVGKGSKPGLPGITGCDGILGIPGMNPERGGSLGKGL